MGYTEGHHNESARDAIELALVRPVESIENVLESFAEVKPLLSNPEVGLAHVEPFWEIYGDVSAAVYEGLGTGKFRRPQDVEHTLPIFYNQARLPLLAHVQGLPHVIPAEWRRSLYSPSVIHAQPGVQFLNHMNSHINNDLGQALYMSGVHEDYKPDFTLMVGKMLEDVASKHAEQYIPLRSGMMRTVALKACLQYIAVARERAWRDGKKLQAAHQNTDSHKQIVRRIEQTAVAQGRLLLHGSNLLLGAAAQTETIAGRVKRPPQAA